MDDRPRCRWPLAHPELVHYHDHEWGLPLHDDRRHFEYLVLEAAQAGLSWWAVFRKRARYREVFFDFDPVRVAEMGPPDVERLLQDAGIIRNRAKILAAIHNATPFQAVQAEFGSFSRYIWDFVGGEPVRNAWTDEKQVPPRTELSDRVSADLKRRGFKFVGSTVVYAHLQAAGLVDDHVAHCFRKGPPPA